MTPNKDNILDRICRIQEDRMSGSLKLERDGKEIRVTFCNGLIDAAGSNITQLQLGKVLARKGLLQNSVLPRLLDKARRKSFLLGKTAVVQKLLNNSDLKDGLRDQIIHTISYAQDNEFEIGPFTESPTDLYTPAQLDSNHLILELARTNIKPFELDPAQQVQLSNGHNISNLPWYPQELAVLNLLETSRTLQDIATATGMDYTRLGKILSVFDKLELINRTDESKNEATDDLKREGFNANALIPEIGESTINEKLETYHNDASFISEQFKTLKIKIGKAPTENQLQLIAVSSSSPEDGKSLVCANMAVSFAQDSHRRVVIVDCDMRNPSLHKMLGTTTEPGLRGYLETENLQPYCYMRRFQSLHVITAGGVSTNPIELMSNARMKELIAYLRTEFDTIILDCPPFGPISDAQILSEYADGLLMVVRSGHTTYGTIEKAFQHVDRSKLIGMIFNDVKPMMFNTRYDYKYYHYKKRNSYPYAAGAKSNKPRTKTYID